MVDKVNERVSAQHRTRFILSRSKNGQRLVLDQTPNFRNGWKIKLKNGERTSQNIKLADVAKLNKCSKGVAE